MCPTAPGDFSYCLNRKTTQDLNRKWRGCMAASAGGARQDFLGPPRILQTFVFILFDDSYRLFILFYTFWAWAAAAGFRTKEFQFLYFYAVKM